MTADDPATALRASPATDRGTDREGGPAGPRPEPVPVRLQHSLLTGVITGWL